MEKDEKIFQCLGRLEGKMDLALEQLEKNNREIENLDNRVETLEKDKSFICGISAAIGGAVALFVQVWTGGR